MPQRVELELGLCGPLLVEQGEGTLADERLQPFERAGGLDGLGVGQQRLHDAQHAHGAVQIAEGPQCARQQAEQTLTHALEGRRRRCRRCSVCMLRILMNRCAADECGQCCLVECRISDQRFVLEQVFAQVDERLQRLLRHLRREIARAIVLILRAAVVGVVDQILRHRVHVLGATTKHNQMTCRSVSTHSSFRARGPPQPAAPHPSDLSEMRQHGHECPHELNHVHLLAAVHEVLVVLVVLGAHALVVHGGERRESALLGLFDVVRQQAQQEA